MFPDIQLEFLFLYGGGGEYVAPEKWNLQSLKESLLHSILPQSQSFLLQTIQEYEVT